MLQFFDQATRDTAQRLVNAFLASIPQGEKEEGGSIDTFEIVRVFTKDYLRKEAANRNQINTLILPVGDFIRDVDDNKLKDYAAFNSWLLLAPPGLTIATESLTAFCRLLHCGFENDGLQKSKNISRNNEDSDRSIYQSLKNVMSPVAINSILSEDSLPRPIGVFLRKGERIPRDSADVRKQPTKSDEIDQGNRQAPNIFQIQSGTGPVNINM